MRGIENVTPARYILLLLLASFFALLGVAQRGHGVHLGLRVGCLKAETDLLAENNRQLLCEISALSDPARIAGQVERMKLALLDPVALTKTVAAERDGETAAPVRKAPATRR
jgi:hypothetical protein